MEKLQEAIDHFKLNVLTIQDVPESHSSEVFKIQLLNQENVYIKIPYTKTKLFREYETLNLLHNEVSVPTILDFWEGDEIHTGALLLENINGVPCTGKVSPQLAYQIGVNHAKIHAVSMLKYGTFSEKGFQSLDNNDWSAFVRKKFLEFEPYVKEVLSPELYEKSIVHFEKRFNALPEPENPSIIHMDFRPGNILIRDDSVVGIIDFESARSGATEMDFTKINRDIFNKYPKTKEAYIAGYETIRPIIDLNQVLSFYSFYDAFNSIGWCKIRGIEQHQDFLNESVNILNRSILDNTDKN